MVEIFRDINEITKEAAALIWELALTKRNPVEMADFLNEKTNEFRKIVTEQDIEFLQFYFKMKMEEMKNEGHNSDQR